VLPEEKPGKEVLPPEGAPAGKNGMTPAAYSQRPDTSEMAQAVAKARAALSKSKGTAKAEVVRTGNWGRDGLVGLAVAALNSPTPPAAGAPAVPPPAESAVPPPAPPVQAAQHPAAVTPVAAPSPPAVRPAPAPAPQHPADVTQSHLADHLTLLASATHASDRAWAASQLASADWRGNPRVVDNLVAGARGDRDAEVRLACIAALVKLNVDTSDAVTTFHTIAAADGDARVRDAANSALARLQRH
jgi:hypothetical protein